MSQQSNLQGLFERPTTLPDPDAQGRLARLVGMDDKIKRLANVLGVLINPAGLRKWQDKHHADAAGLTPFAVACSLRATGLVEEVPTPLTPGTSASRAPSYALREV